ncbi:MAG: phenylacetate-CoA oxygenase/reductase subunit PaaK [Nocardioides sp.]|nr:phenylacetate-CoA oxygenase/reductase subunit PaaK [Nocardioides sp.]
MAFHTLTVREVQPLTADSAAITFDVPEELRDTYAFAPGQALTLRKEVDGVEERRTYSICAPLGAAPRIGVREIPGGRFSRWLVRGLRAGDTVEVGAPSGTFRADPRQAGRHLCIAAGSGITPMLSIISSVLENPDSSATLLYGNRETSSVMFVEEIGDLKNRYGDRFEVMHVLSREPREVELFSGRLDPDRLRRLLPLMVALDDVDHVWLCGPHAMTEGARGVLAELGVPAGKVHVELFWVDEPPPTLRHPDRVLPGDTSEVTLVLDGRSTTAPVPRDRTVLDSAQAVRADVPFACKGGVCGTCRARVVSGEVDMVRNYALEPDEVGRGFVLTCQSFPVSDEVTVDFDA